MKKYILINLVLVSMLSANDFKNSIHIAEDTDGVELVLSKPFDLTSRINNEKIRLKSKPMQEFTHSEENGFEESGKIVQNQENIQLSPFNDSKPSTPSIKQNYKPITEYIKTEDGTFEKIGIINLEDN